MCISCLCVFDLLTEMVSCRAPVLELGVSIALCILLVLMVVGLFVFESVSVSWSCLVVPGALVQLDAG